MKKPKMHFQHKNNFAKLHYAICGVMPAWLSFNERKVTCKRCRVALKAERKARK